jgi:hypothetical protein
MSRAKRIRLDISTFISTYLGSKYWSSALGVYVLSMLFGRPPRSQIVHTSARFSLFSLYGVSMSQKRYVNPERV